jgi:hypothetical protein
MLMKLTPGLFLAMVMADSRLEEIAKHRKDKVAFGVTKTQANSQTTKADHRTPE